MATCLKPIEKCVDVGVHDPVCRCDQPAGHNGHCYPLATLSLFPSLRIRES